MDKKQTGPRRAFVKACLGFATMAVANPSRLAWAQPVRHYGRALLTDDDDKPITSDSIRTDEAFVFHYPYVTTPCFLINLGKPLDSVDLLETASEGSYAWQGGSGPRQSIVAFSAICAHKLSYPTRTTSFINYRPKPVRFVSANQDVSEKSQIIYCCSERSAYDPAHGASVLGGPARQPLTAVELEYDAGEDRFYAIGTRGGELFETFFEKFGFRLALDHKLDDVQAPVTDKTIVYPHNIYSRHVVSC